MASIIQSIFGVTTEAFDDPAKYLVMAKSKGPIKLEVRRYDSRFAAEINCPENSNDETSPVKELTR